MIAAISTDGFIAGPNNDTSWISKEDTTLLRQTIKKHDVLVMGSRTFDQYKDVFAKTTARQRYILTSRPADYAKHNNLAHFVDLSLVNLLEDLFLSGYMSVLILGGSRLYEDCLTHGIANEVLISIEPTILDRGTTFLSVARSVSDYPHYKLVSTNNLNSNGTVLKRYLLQT